MFEQVIKDYSHVTPATWSPLTSDTELWHRLRLFSEMSQALKLVSKPIETLRVLDVGCGAGRSTRALLEFGILPENLTGVDIREEDIEYSSHMNPAINFKLVSSLQDIKELGDFDLCCQCTVFSSIKDPQERLHLAEAITSAVKPGGHLFWWDRRYANDFAGGDRFLPEEYFKSMQIVYKAEVPLQWEARNCIRPLRGVGRLIAAV